MTEIALFSYGTRSWPLFKDGRPLNERRREDAVMHVGGHFRLYQCSQRVAPASTPMRNQSENSRRIVAPFIAVTAARIATEDIGAIERMTASAVAGRAPVYADHETMLICTISRRYRHFDDRSCLDASRFAS